MSLYSSSSFSIGPLVAPKLSTSEVNALLEPLLSQLRTLGITYTSSIATYSNFLDAYHNTGFGSIGVGIFQFGGWLLPRTLFQSETSFNNMMQVIRNITEQGGSAYDVILRPPPILPHSAPKAILPAWRTSQKFLISLL